MSKPIIIIGGGGHAAVLLDILQMQNRKIIAYVAPEQAKNNPIFEKIMWLAQDDIILSYDQQAIELVNGIGSLPGASLRAQLFNQFKAAGFHFSSVICQSATVSRYATLAEGVQILSGAIINIGADIAENTIVNSGAIVEHHCCIGAHNHLAPGVTLSGGVVTKQHAHIGTGANIIQSVTIGQNTIVGAGATVTQNINNNETIYPAQTFTKQAN